MTTAVATSVDFQGPVPPSETDQAYSGAVSPVGLNEPPLAGLLAGHGYGEDEYFVSGTVAAHPYKTSLLVRKPADLSVRGSLRSPYVDVPTARYEPAKYLRHLIGAEMPFSPERLRDLYASREEYLRRFDDSIDSLAKDRLILSADAGTLKAEEAARAAF